MVPASQAVYTESALNKRQFPWGIVLVVIVLLAFAALLVKTISNVTSEENLPVRKVQVQGAFEHVDERSLKKVLSGISGQGYFSLNIMKIQSDIESLPWVKHAEVRRVWPETLVVHIEEQVPLATWNDASLVNSEGELFHPENIKDSLQLPEFYGATGSEQRMKEWYQEMQVLLDSVNRDIAVFKMDERGSIRLHLDSNVELILGREDILTRLSRYIKVYDNLHSQFNRPVVHVDLRYTNGMAVK